AGLAESPGVSLFAFCADAKYWYAPQTSANAANRRTKLFIGSPKEQTIPASPEFRNRNEFESAPEGNAKAHGGECQAAAKGAACAEKRDLSRLSDSGADR